MFKIVTKNDNLIENKICQAFIMSDDFIKSILPIYNAEYLQNKYIVIVTGWIIEYYKKYEQSPKNNIINIFDFHKGDLREDEYSLIEEILKSLSDDFDGLNNYQYLINETIKYFKVRAYKVLSEKINNACSFGDIDETEKILSDFRSVEQQLDGWIDPFDRSEIIKTFDQQDKDNLFAMPGDLGRLLGYHKRGDLVGIMAPPKKGKTAMLQEFAVQALLSRLSVLFVSHEMGAQKSKMRLYKRLSGIASKDTYKMPVFDCVRNQNGECKNINRKNKIKIMDADGNIKPDTRYETCDFCRDKNSKEYALTVYYTIKKNKRGNEQVIERVEKFQKWIKPRLLFRSYPQSSAKVSALLHEVKMLEQSRGFIPDVIITDYFTIAAPENTNLSERGRIDETWKVGKRIAEEFRVAHFTGHQGNRASIDAKQIKQSHASEDMRVLAHCDLMVGLAQTDHEKNMGVIRANTLVARDEYFVGSNFVTMLCNFDIGQILIDSEFGGVN